jgi:trk system potassium uptake protein TrkA
MNIIICGSGDVGSHAAEHLASMRHSITVIDLNAGRLRAIGDALDVRTLQGNCAEATVLREAQVQRADMLVAATNVDEVNLLTACVAKGLGAAKCIARVHHSAFFAQRGMNYQQHLNIDRLICPEYSTALSIARRLRNPVAMVIEDFARGAVEMQQFKVKKSASAVGKSLRELVLPRGARLTAITRKGGTFIPEAATAIEPGDTIVLVANADVFNDARRLFHREEIRRRKVVLMGGGPMSVWLCRTLHDRNFSIRLFVDDRERAEVLAEKLDWVTVLQGDPTDRVVFDEEHLANADAFIALEDDDEANIISGVVAKARGVPEVITVVQRTQYLDVVFDIGVDSVFSPRTEAAREIEGVLDDRPIRYLGSLAEGVVDLLQIRVGEGAMVTGKRLREVKLSPEWVVAAIQHDQLAHVPGPDDTFDEGDVVLVLGRRGNEDKLRKIFHAR